MKKGLEEEVDSRVEELVSFVMSARYHDIENSMICSKEYITIEQVQLTLKYSCNVQRHFEGDKDVQASGLFVRGRTSQQERSKSKHRLKSCVNKKNA
ncbi:hypothetical protein HAX54_038377 [Datura stramonium]|uniref:Uncharacterized protein n=1 Tax=Datura stramonium TaxID=4076 RepID=A0ABS8SI54_DATST|nr:hypothetical protein [Datura stramonium]